MCECDSVLVSKGLMGVFIETGVFCNIWRWSSKVTTSSFRQEETRREIILSPGAIKISDWYEFNSPTSQLCYSWFLLLHVNLKSCANKTSCPSLQSQKDKPKPGCGIKPKTVFTLLKVPRPDESKVFFLRSRLHYKHAEATGVFDPLERKDWKNKGIVVPRRLFRCWWKWIRDPGAEALTPSRPRELDRWCTPGKTLKCARVDGCNSFFPPQAEFVNKIPTYLVTKVLKIDSTWFRNGSLLGWSETACFLNFGDEFVSLLRDNYAVWGNYAYIVLLRR